MEMTKSKAKNKGYVVALRKCANVPHNISSTGVFIKFINNLPLAA